MFRGPRQLLSVTPLVKRGFLSKVPVVRTQPSATRAHAHPPSPARSVPYAAFCLCARHAQIGGYWEDKTPASDKPF